MWYYVLIRVWSLLLYYYCPSPKFTVNQKNCVVLLNWAHIQILGLVQGGHSPVMIKFPDFSLTFSNISRQYLWSIDPLNSSDIKTKCMLFLIAILIYTVITMTTMFWCTTLPSKELLSYIFCVENNTRGNWPRARTHFPSLFQVFQVFLVCGHPVRTLANMGYVLLTGTAHSTCTFHIRLYNAHVLHGHIIRLHEAGTWHKIQKFVTLILTLILTVTLTLTIDNNQRCEFPPI